MRISDWSSDVCSSDLLLRACGPLKETDQGGAILSAADRLLRHLGASLHGMRPLPSPVAQAGDLSGQLEKLVEVASELIESESDPEQAAESSCRKGTHQACSPHFIEGSPVRPDGVGKGVDILRRMPTSQKVACSPENRDRKSVV